MFKFLNKKQADFPFCEAQIGLEINDSKLGVTTIMPTQRGHKILNNFTMKIDNKKIGRNLLTQVRQKIPSEFKKTILGMSINDVMIKQVKLDACLSDKNIFDYLSHNSEEYFGEPIDKLMIDFERLATTKDEANRTELRVVATRRNKLFPLIENLSQAGFEMKAVDVDVFALVRILPFCDVHACHKITGIVYIYPNGLVYCVVKDQQLIYSKGEIFNFTNPNQPDNTQIFGTINRALQYYKARYPALKLEQIILAGESQHLVELVILISEQLNITTSIARISEKVFSFDSIFEDESKINNPAILMSCGLGLWGSDNEY